MRQGSIVVLVLKAIALAVSVAAVVLSVLKTAAPETLIMLVSIGLFALALAAFQRE